MKKIIFISILFLFAASSCNYKLLVHKDNIYHCRTGYLIFFNRQKIFFPAKNIEGDNFFKSKIKGPGYIVNFEENQDVFYSIAEKYVIDHEYLYNGKNIFVRDTLKIVPVEIGSLPFKLKIKKGLGDFTIKHNDQLFRLKYSSTNNESVWTVYPILKEDIEGAALYFDKYLLNNHYNRQYVR